ncbi:ChaN family lipoprotein [Namhaeicola litoreus]|uniref:ChaN family lipoprotein n=1 Tax=Namhaeicola litoreus TaxID=1052145 RepID=A0ABW3Y3H4_9FLAO
MKNIVLTFLNLALFIPLMAQQNPAYQIFDFKGKQTEYNEMLKELAKSDMVFFGEHHDNPISHWLELEVTQGLFEKTKGKLILGAEMFENGNQLVLNEYLSGFYEEDKMMPEVTQLWSNYETDYRALVQFAKENKIPFIATNIPRRYASMIYKGGIEALDQLSPEAKRMIGPELKKYFDPTVKAYAEMKDQMGGHVPPNMLNIQISQASKDATMAHFIINSYEKKHVFLHYNGSYHSDNDQGIIWWINKIKPGYDIMSITTVNKSDWDKMDENEKRERADYYVVVPDNMPRSKR